MNYYLGLLEQSVSKYSKSDDKIYTFTEKELIRALECLYDYGMDWAYKLMQTEIEKHITRDIEK